MGQPGQTKERAESATLSLRKYGHASDLGRGSYAGRPDVAGRGVRDPCPTDYGPAGGAGFDQPTANANRNTRSHAHHRPRAHADTNSADFYGPRADGYRPGPHPHPHSNSHCNCYSYSYSYSNFQSGADCGSGPQT